MTHSLCQRRRSADRTIRLFSGGDGRAREIDANLLDRRARTRVACRGGPSIRQRLLWQSHYDGNDGAAAACRRAAPAGAAVRAGRTPQIVLRAPPNTRRFCVLGDAERRAQGFLP
ncbi:hypothetical protein [Burkholderia anthina]|uniref:hypothetical protein n=1 Tax=Burkholderia anthina TaxID=179879 RepID=UPI001589B405|nr:hypothetical protein [Burkholderia anthina]